MEEVQAKFEGWAIVEMMGHQRAIGYVTTEHYGAAALFRIDTPELPERDFLLPKPGYVDEKWVPSGSSVRRPLLPAHSQLVGPSSLYRMTPCDEETARKALEEMQARPLILLSVPEGKEARPQLPGEVGKDICDDCGIVIDENGECACDMVMGEEGAP